MLVSEVLPYNHVCYQNCTSYLAQRVNTIMTTRTVLRFYAPQYCSQVENVFSFSILSTKHTFHITLYLCMHMHAVQYR